jgi:iron complex transport system substrate-binding protein
MKRLAALLLFVLVVFGGVYALKLHWLDTVPPDAPPAPEAPAAGAARTYDCSRIVSMAPSLTESLFAIGLGDNVVGVTRYCTFPPEATKRTAIGGYFDPNYEQIIALEPSIVAILPVHAEHRTRLNDLGIETLEVDKAKVPDILDSLGRLGRACGAAEAGDALASALRTTQDQLMRKTAGLPRPGVLIVVDREMGMGRVRDVYVAGKGTFYDDLLGMAGGSNVYDGKLIQYPTLSTEGLLRVNPQVVIEIVPQVVERGLSPETLLADWESMPTLNAVREKRIVILTESYAAVPGPRYVRLLEDMARAVHPEVDWEAP